METTYFSLTIALHRLGRAYQVQLSHEDPNSQAQVAPIRAVAAIDIEALLASVSRPADYGRLLAEQLFTDEAVAERFTQVETAAQASQAFLRVQIAIDPSAQELQSLRWELLCHPQRRGFLSTSEQILISRFMVSRDWQPVKLRARTELSALIAVSAPNPAKLARMKLAPVDYEGESGRVREVLAGVNKLDSLGGPGSPLTLDALIEALRTGVDILYLVSHGKFGRSGLPALILQDQAGEARPVQAEDLAGCIGELQRKPRLIVLASCESAGTGEQLGAGHQTTVQATLASRLADAGVPGVLAMQGTISMATVEQMMPTLFAELLRDGQIDRALAVARARVHSRPDFWMPALFTRLTLGRLWYTPGFASGKAKEVWQRLLTPVANGKVVPIVGPRLLEAAHGSAHDTATRLADAHRYPLAAYETDDLPRVTAYLSVKESRYNVVRAYQDQLLADLLEQHRGWLPEEEVKKRKLGRLLALVGDRLREREDDPYRILAELPAAVYLTTNFDPLIERALRAKQRAPQQLATRWRYKKAPLSTKDQHFEEPSAKAPIVYHVFGAFGSSGEDGLILTEDDYFDYLITAVGAKLIPGAVESALVDNSLLFLGFRLTDWHFRVLFRLMMNLPGRDRLKHYRHVAVQLDPDMEAMTDVEGAKAYLAEYFGKQANIDIFWGSSEEFLAALRNELETRDLSLDEADEEEDEDEWTF